MNAAAAVPQCFEPAVSRAKSHGEERYHPETSSKSSISLLEKLDFSSRLVCFPLFHRNRIGKPGFWSGFQAQKARFSPPKPGFWSGFQARKARFSSPKPGRNRTKNRPPKPLCNSLTCPQRRALRLRLSRYYRLIKKRASPGLRARFEGSKGRFYVSSPHAHAPP